MFISPTVTLNLDILTQMTYFSLFLYNHVLIPGNWQGEQEYPTHSKKKEG
jgi:hypothetical protein